MRCREDLFSKSSFKFLPEQAARGISAFRQRKKEKESFLSVPSYQMAQTHLQWDLIFFEIPPASGQCNYTHTHLKTIFKLIHGCYIFTPGEGSPSCRAADCRLNSAFVATRHTGMQMGNKVTADGPPSLADELQTHQLC